MTNTAHLFIAGVRAALDKKFTVKDYLVKTRKHNDQYVADLIAAAKAEWDDID